MGLATKTKGSSSFEECPLHHSIALRAVQKDSHDIIENKKK